MVPGLHVMLRVDVKDTMNNVIVPAGARGIVNACIDSMRIVTTFYVNDGSNELRKLCLVVAFTSLEKADAIQAPPCDAKTTAAKHRSETIDSMGSAQSTEYAESMPETE